MEKKNSGRSSKTNAKKEKRSGRRDSKNILTVLVVFAMVLICVIYYFNNKKDTPAVSEGLSGIFSGTTQGVTDKLNVHFIDVGQGDCIFIQFPDGKNMLIDGGKSSDQSRNNFTVIKNYLTKLNVNKIDVLLATHQDADHIGTLDKVLGEYEVSYCLRPSVYYSAGDGLFDSVFNPAQPADGTPSKTSTYRNYLKAVADERCGWEFYNRNSDFSQAFTFDGGNYLYSVDFLSPTRAVGAISYDDANDYSPIFVVSYMGFDLMLTGDASVLNEKEVLDYYGQKVPDIDVLKVGHHGSDTSSSAAFIAAVKPENAVIMCGTGNSYKHPKQKTLDALLEVSCNVFRTDLEGSVVLSADKDGNYTFSTEKPKAESSELYKAP